VRSEHMAVGIKEMLELPKSVIDDRFSLNSKEGISIEYFGNASKGMFGGGFIYTNKESLSIGVVASIRDAAQRKIKCEGLLEDFKNHPCVSKLIRGGKSIEYSAHLLPEFGYDHIPDLTANGVLMTGDCAGFVNMSHFHEGTNLAMASGKLAAETVIEAAEKGDFSQRTLKEYVKKLRKSFVFKDMKKFRRFPQIFQKHPEFLTEYPEILAELTADYFSISHKPKKEIEKEIFRKFRKKIGILNSSRIFLSLVRGMGWI